MTRQGKSLLFPTLYPAAGLAPGKSKYALGLWDLSKELAVLRMGEAIHIRGKRRSKRQPWHAEPLFTNTPLWSETTAENLLLVLAPCTRMSFLSVFLLQESLCGLLPSLLTTNSLDTRCIIWSYALVVSGDIKHNHREVGEPSSPRLGAYCSLSHTRWLCYVYSVFSIIPLCWGIENAHALRETGNPLLRSAQDTFPTFCVVSHFLSTPAQLPPAGKAQEKVAWWECQNPLGKQNLLSCLSSKLRTKEVKDGAICNWAMQGGEELSFPSYWFPMGITSQTNSLLDFLASLAHSATFSLWLRLCASCK